MKTTEKKAILKTNVNKLNDEDLAKVSGGSIFDLLKSKLVWEAAWRHVTTAL